jgi:hypothetical protein
MRFSPNDPEQMEAFHLLKARVARGKLSNPEYSLVKAVTEATLNHSHNNPSLYADDNPIITEMRRLFEQERQTMLNSIRNLLSGLQTGQVQMSELEPMVASENLAILLAGFDDRQL